MYQFIWDENKNQVNKRKHGIDFNEAMTVFLDEQAIMFDDPEHSEEGDRFLLLGISYDVNVLIVCHCYREKDEVIRIISARKATRKEESYYVGRI